MVNKRDAEVFIVCLLYHFDVGLFHIIGQGGTPLAVLDDTCILTMTRLSWDLIRLKRIYNF
jgi:hypothetical protein